MKEFLKTAGWIALTSAGCAAGCGILLGGFIGLMTLELGMSLAFAALGAASLAPTFFTGIMAYQWYENKFSETSVFQGSNTQRNLAIAAGVAATLGSTLIGGQVMRKVDIIGNYTTPAAKAKPTGIVEQTIITTHARGRGER